MKKKLDLMTKTKLIFSGEYIVISLVFLVIAILEFSNVITITQRHHEIFNWITIFGGTWLVIDFFWMLLSKKRRAKGCLIDKITLLPLGIYLISYDIVSFINYNQMIQPFYQYGIPAAILYICVIYIFQGIYHWFHPLPEIIEEVEKELAEEKEKSEACEHQQQVMEDIQKNIENDEKKE